MGAGGGRRSALLGRIPPDRGLGTSRSGRARCCIACAARSDAIRGFLMNRRDFVVSLSAAAGVLGWRSRRSSAARIRFGYAAITWNGNDRQAIDDIAAIGFRGIQLRQSAFDTWADRPAELKDLLAQKGLVLVALSSGNVSLDPATEQATLARHAVHARFVRDVGGRYLQVIDERPRG